MNPQKFNRANTVEHKTRKRRQQKLYSSRRAKHNCAKNIEAPNSGLSQHGFACPYCTVLGIQNNSKNVLQHVQAKHATFKAPEVKDMRKAADAYQERLEDISKELDGRI